MILQSGQLLHVRLDEADLVVPERAVRFAGLFEWRRAVLALRLPATVDRIPVQVKQEVLTMKVIALRGE